MIPVTKRKLSYCLAANVFLQGAVISTAPLLIESVTITQPPPVLVLTLPAPLPPPPPPPAPANPKPVVPVKPPPRRLTTLPVIQKPVETALFEAPQELMGGGGVVGGIPGGVPSGVVGSIPAGLPPPPPPPVERKAPPPPAAPERIVVSKEVQEARLLFLKKPEYPMMAKQMRLQGTVRLEAVVSTEGTVTQIRVVNGHPLLIPPVLEAVAQWRYRPTYLDGKAVEVATVIDVNFSLIL